MYFHQDGTASDAPFVGCKILQGGIPGFGTVRVPGWCLLISPTTPPKDQDTPEGLHWCEVQMVAKAPAV